MVFSTDVTGALQHDWLPHSADWRVYDPLLTNSQFPMLKRKCTHMTMILWFN